jgi:zinc protease
VATKEPFLYSLSFTAMEGIALQTLEAAALEVIERVCEEGLTDEEVARARRQLRARLVFETDSVTNIAHQLGYFETVAGPGFFETIRPSLDEVTPARVAEAARQRLRKEARTVGWFQPSGRPA